MASPIGVVSSFLRRRSESCSPSEFRLISPICSAIEARSPKQAVLLCAKGLKLHKNHCILLALKAVATSQLSKPLSMPHKVDILAAVELVKSESNGAGLGDADVLTLLGWVLQYVGLEEEMLNVLAKATQRHPENEDVCLEAFTHYVRVGEMKSAQQIGMKLQRMRPDQARYRWWSITSLLLQARHLEDPSTPLLLALSERQINSALAVSTNQNDQEASSSLKGHVTGKGKGVAHSSSSSSSSSVLQYRSVHEFHLVARHLELHLQAAAADDIAARTSAFLLHFASEEGKIWCERGLGLEIWRRESELKYGTAEGGEWESAWDRLSGAIEAGDANWHTMLFLVRTTFSRAAAGCTAGKPVPSQEGIEILARTRAIFRRLANEDKRERGYLLALIEIARECRSRAWPEETDISLATLCIEYFDTFCTKMCCFDDLQPYFDHLTSDESRLLREHVDTVCLSPSSQLTPNDAQRCINASKISRSINPVILSAVEHESLAEAYLEFYANALPLGRGLPVTELQPADDFALLSGQAYVAAWSQSHDRSLLEKALLVLTLASSNSKHKYQICILIVLLYRLLGAPSASLAHYRLLGIKSIQFDTLSHLIINRGSTFAVGGQDPLMAEAEMAIKWYETGKREAADMVVQALTIESYSKVEEFVVFADRLEFSLSKCLLRIETLRTRTVRGSALDLEALTADFLALNAMVQSNLDRFPDNRDYLTLPDLQPRVGDSIWRMSEVGPRIKISWLRAFCSIYHRMLIPSVSIESLPSDLAKDDLTSSEYLLLMLSCSMSDLHTAELDNLIPQGSVIDFFKGQVFSFETCVQDDSKLPWEILHTAEIAFEGYCLLDLAIERRAFELLKSKPTDHAARTKRLRALRNTSREIVRELGTKVSMYAKQVAKHRPKVVASLGSLKTCPLIDEDSILSFSHSLIESRKTAAEALAAGMIRRCAK